MINFWGIALRIVGSGLFLVGVVAKGVLFVLSLPDVYDSANRLSSAYEDLGQLSTALGGQGVTRQLMVDQLAANVILDEVIVILLVCALSMTCFVLASGLDKLTQIADRLEYQPYLENVNDYRRRDDY